MLKRFYHYPTSGSPSDFDCAIGSSFGTDITPEGVNIRIVEELLFWARLKRNVPIAIDEMLTNIWPDKVAEPEVVVKEQELATWSGLLLAKAFMAEDHLERPLIVGHYYLARRIALQARKLGMEPIVPPWLPRQFDSSSQQFATRGKVRWLTKEITGRPYLKLAGKL